MLKKEKNYAFRKRMLEIHPKDLRQEGLQPREDEFVIQNGFSIHVSRDADDVILTAASDFQTYLLVSMGVSSMIVREKTLSQAVGNAIVLNTEESAKAALTEGKGYMGYRIDFPDGIAVTGFDSRGIAQALYCLEDMMSVRRAPYLPREAVERKALFSPRIVHSGYDLCKYPNEYLAAVAHAGMDAIAVFISEPNADYKGQVDFNELVYRAGKYGIDVYVYSNMDGNVYPKGEDARKFYDARYGRIFENAPGLKGVILVGESIEFPSKDPNVRSATRKTPYPDNIPDGKPSPGWYPCEDYPLFVNMLKDVIRCHRPDADIVFWTYNWGSRPEDARIKLIQSLPTDISLLVTYEMFQRYSLGDGIVERTPDYTLALEGPGEYFLSEAKAAKECGIRLYAMSNTAGLTWDFGMIPYEPMPYQWVRRYEGLKQARRDYGLCGLLECHHYGFYPSFISELAKYAFCMEKTPYDQVLLNLMSRDCGDENAAAVVNGLRDWSEAIRCYVPTDNDQYGAARIGPAFPFCITAPFMPPVNKYAHAKNPRGFYDPMHGGLTYGNISLYSIRIRKEIEMLEKSDAYMASGLAKMTSCTGIDNHEALLRLINLGEYIRCNLRTIIHVKHWFILRQQLSVEQDRQKLDELVTAMSALLDKEIENAQKAIPLAEVDSRLGWEPCLEYQADADHIRWKIKQAQYVQRFELKSLLEQIHASL